MNDTDIINLYYERNEDAVRETMNSYHNRLLRFAMRFLSDSRDAEECVNDTWLRAWDSMPPQRPAKLSVFLGKITRNLSLDRYRNYSAEKRKGSKTAEVIEELSECISGGDNVSDYIDKMVLTELIVKFLRKQNEANRNIFIRRYWRFDSIREIAEDFGMNDRSVATILFRMRTQLKKELLEEGIEV